MRRWVIVLTFAGLLCGIVGIPAYRAMTSVSVIETKPVSTSIQKVLPPADPGPNDWPWWRGPHSDGVGLTASPPTEWNPSEHVAWSTPLPGRGHSSPIVWGDDVLLTSADEQARTQSLLCLDLPTGSIRWTRQLHQGDLPPKHEKNSHASSTPGCDGTQVYTAFAVNDAVWVSAVNREDGEIVWQTEAGPYESHRGYGSSVAIYDSLVIVVGESRGSKLNRITAMSFLAALDRATGEIVWRIRRPEEHSYGSPVVLQIAGRDQLLISGGGDIHAYDPKTGESFWHCATTCERTANTMAAGESLAFASGSHPQAELVCVRADGSGDVTNTHVLWTQRKGVSDVPSPVYHDGLLYVLADNGILTALDADTGESHWRKRLGGDFSASPVIVGDYLYAIDEEGTTSVLTIGTEADVVAKNELNEPAFATPTPVGSRLLIRTSQTLWCLGHE